MRKTILTGASILALSVAAPAFAQASQSEIDQLGNDNSATVEQTGNENVSDIDQDGDENTAIVDQEVAPPGIAGFNVPANKATIDQNGDGGFAYVEQSSIKPAGPGNEATVTQYSADGAPEGTGNETPPQFDPSDYSSDAAPANNGAAILQGTGANGGPNKASITQGAAGAEVYGNAALIMQGGDDNTSSVNQQSLGASATNMQTGDGNSSTISQSDSTLIQSIGTAPDAEFDPEAFVTQSGDDNTSFVSQDGTMDGPNGRNLVADVLQTGNNNFSDIDQNAMGPGFTGTYRATVTQTGDSTSNIEQTGEGQGIRNFKAEVISDDSTSTILQSGMGSNSGDLDAFVDQSGGSTSTINQIVNTTTGGSPAGGTPQAGFVEADVTQRNGATATINQTVLGDSSGGQEAIVNQDGASEVVIDQTFIDRTGPDFSRDFVADVTQSGTGNLVDISQEDQGAANINDQDTPELTDDVGDSNVKAMVAQSGTSNEIFVDQFNRNQVVDITQTGEDNLVDALQDGIGNKLTVTEQSGNDNKIFSIQNGGGTGTVTQGGEFNTTNLTQSGSSNQRATIDQLGVSNTANVTQQGTARQEDAFITQLGDLSNSTASITQNGAADGDRSDNYASILQQSGDNNMSTIEQTGRNNVALSEQTGSNLISTIMQDGTGNTALVGQLGDGHVSHVNQTGNGNTATVSQGGAAVPVVPAP